MELLDKSIEFLSGGSGKENTAPSKPEMNAKETYGRYIADTLNRFSPYLRMYAKKKISDVLFEIE